MLSLEEQLAEAVHIIKSEFPDGEQELPPIPPGTTVEELWAKLHAKPQKPPKIEYLVRLIVENKELAGIPIDLIAGIIREVFHYNGYKCNCSEQSVRWYLSKYALEWSIVRRRRMR